MSETEQWWSQGDIRFSCRQCRWLVSVLAVLHEGHWPRNPLNPGYIDPPYRKKDPGRHASFEGPEMVAAEIETRMEACGLDGCLVEAFYGWNKDPRSLTRYFHMDERELAKRAARCVRYMSGWNRKRTTYREFVNHRKTEAACGTVQPVDSEAKMKLNNALCRT
jgi:hypothetical protein